MGTSTRLGKAAWLGIRGGCACKFFNLQTRFAPATQRFPAVLSSCPCASSKVLTTQMPTARHVPVASSCNLRYRPRRSKSPCCCGQTAKSKPAMRQLEIQTTLSKSVTQRTRGLLLTPQKIQRGSTTARGLANFATCDKSFRREVSKVVNHQAGKRPKKKRHQFDEGAL